MKIFVNLLILDDDGVYEKPDELEDVVVRLVEDEGLEVLWSKSSEAKE